jgi:hypothetical protein
MRLSGGDESQYLSYSEEDEQDSAINRMGSFQFVIVSAASKWTMLPSDWQAKRRGEGESVRSATQVHTSERGNLIQGAAPHKLRLAATELTERLSVRIVTTGN